MNSMLDAPSSTFAAERNRTLSQRATGILKEVTEDEIDYGEE